jgi:hypothetical protein
MKNTQTIGRLGAWLTSIFLILFVSFLILIFPSKGLPADQGALYNPQLVLDFASHTWLLRGFYAHYFIGIFGFLLLVYAVSKHNQSIHEDLGKFRNIVGYFAIALLFLNSVMQYLNAPLLLYLLPNQPDETYATYLSITLIAGALVYAAFFCMGIWLIISNLDILKSKKTSSPFAYLGILTGIFGMCSILLTALSYLFIICMVIWLIWLIIIFPKLAQQ